MSARGTTAPSTQGELHWTHRTPERFRAAQGEEHYEAKLSAANVRFIREARAAKTHTQKQLARMFGVSVTSVQDVEHVRTWKTVK